MPVGLLFVDEASPLGLAVRRGRIAWLRDFFVSRSKASMAASSLRLSALSSCRILRRFKARASCQTWSVKMKVIRARRPFLFHFPNKQPDKWKGRTFKKSDGLWLLQLMRYRAGESGQVERWPWVTGVPG